MSSATIIMEGEAGRWPRPLTGVGSASKRLRDCARVLKAHVKGLAPEARQSNPAAAWLIENHAYLQSQIRETRRSLPASYLCALPKIGDGPEAELRVYRLAAEFLARSEEVLDSAAVDALADALRDDHSLMLGELWALGSMLKLILLERVCANPGSERVISEATASLRALDGFNWCNFVESVSIVERILEQDPAGTYSCMDFETRDRYRHIVEGLASHSKFSEKAVAEKAIACAAAAPAGERSGHVGYYLVEEAGRAALGRAIGYRASIGDRLHALIERRPSLLYISSIALLTALMVAMFEWLAGPFEQWIAALLLVPASQAALEVVNALTSRLLPPRSLPSMDFSGGIPGDSKTMVVVPTMLFSAANVERLLEDLEIRYLANRETNLYFALLTDFTDADLGETANDSVLVPCVEGIKRLNFQYGSAGTGPFYLFHRRRVWNPSECRWMGYERKRGKLTDLNRLLLGRGNAFEIVVGDTSRLREIRYVLTLDTDTQLPRDTAAKMVAAAAHPLNRPVQDPKTGEIKQGYAVICPRVSVSMESAGRSRLAQIFSGQTGFDPYATAVSDVYQDLHGQASFIGKGIYDVRAFDAAVGDRFPENSILSHDLIEGEYARTGLLTSVELVEAYPPAYEGFMKRKHRWVRGDWQLLPWLLPRTPGPRGQRVRNQLPFLSRWKIFDNLRRSLFEICVLGLFVSGWMTVSNPLRWTLAVLALLLASAYADFLLIIASAPERRFWPAFAANLGERFVESNRAAVLNLILIPHQACIMGDAIVRTLIRRFVTGRNLLEWEPMAQSDASCPASMSLVERYQCVASLAALLFLLWWQPIAIVAALCAIWIAAPLAVLWLNQTPPAPAALEASDTAFLRGIALRTWRFFADHCDPAYNWLVPDNIQEDPPLAAHRASPTNVGLLLTSHLAAFDFGYITVEALSRSIARTLDTVEKMPRYRGHLFNWYDTRTLGEEPPRFISTVDSGNLAASLCAVRQGCMALLSQQVLGQAVLEGLRDHALRLRDEVPYAARSGALMRQFASLLRQFESRPSDLFFWEAVLTEARESMQRIRQSLAGTHALLFEHGELRRSEELQYWETLLAERIEAALNHLYSIAPWLDPVLEPELRLNSRDSSLAALMMDLNRIPALRKLPAMYERVAQRVTERLDEGTPLYPALRRTLEELLQRLPAARDRALEVIRRLEDIAEQAGRLFEAMDFRFLFDAQKKLLRIGWDAETGCASEFCYDLLASEARTAVFLAIAKGDIPREAWFRLGRKLTAYRNRRTLLSWSGTMFEYLMPGLYMRGFANTLLDRAVRGAVAIQQLYAAERKVPWGISEAAHAARDSQMQYQYRAFGIPALSADFHRTETLVLAPYASMLALMTDPRAAASNLRSLAAQGSLGRYGFFESIDYSAGGANGPELIRCFMAHHQGMGLLAIDNALLGGRMQERFHLDPQVQATEFLLQERMPALVEALTDAEDAAA